MDHLDTNSKEVLMNAFQCCDFDSDGLISLEDLQISSGISDYEEAELLYNSLKGGGSAEGGITFQEFCNGIIDFPQLLEQFQADCEQIREGKLEQDTSPSTLDSSEGCRSFDLVEDVSRMLKCTVEFLQSSMGIDFQTSVVDLDGTHKSVSNTIDYIDRFIKTKITPTYSSLDPILSHLALTFWQNFKTLYHSQYTAHQSSLQQVTDLQASNESLHKQVKSYQSQCKSLISRITDLELQSSEEKTQRDNYQRELSCLQSKYQELTESEKIAQCEMSNIQASIYDKEQEIKYLQRQVSRLNSLKTLNDLKQQQPVSPDKYKQLKKIGLTPKAQLFQKDKVFNFSPKPSPRETSSFKLITPFQLMQKQKAKFLETNKTLEAQTDILLEKEAQLEHTLKQKERYYQSEISRLQLKCKDLSLQLKTKEIDSDIDNYSTCDQDNLYQELNQINIPLHPKTKPTRYCSWLWW